MLVIAPACMSEVAKCIDIPAGAMFAGLSVDQLSDLDLSYTRPFGSPWDAVQIGAQAWSAASSSQRPSPPTSETAYGRSRAAPAGGVLTSAGLVGVEPSAQPDSSSTRWTGVAVATRGPVGTPAVRARATSEHMGGVTLARPELSG
jgi:hypothetical protein